MKCRYEGISTISSAAYGTCALPGPPVALRVGGHDTITGCFMLPLSFLVVSRPFTPDRALVMQANRY